MLAQSVLGGSANTSIGGGAARTAGGPQFPVIPDANDRRTATGGLANVTESRQVDTKPTTTTTVIATPNP